MSNEYAISVEALTKRYGALLAVDDVSFTVRRGELFAFLGPNGAGKTTTVEIICAIRSPTSGTVRVLGMDVTQQKRDIIPRIGVLPQGGSSFDRITVRESIQYYARLFGIQNPDIDGLINLTDLTDKRDVQFKYLSGGMKQRLGIAIALVNDPEVVFLDEPTTGLDPQARRAVWDVLLGLKTRGKTIFLTTHYMEEAELLADTVAIIANGKIIAAGSPNELIEASASDMRLTLKAVNASHVELIRTMSFEPVRDDENNITVRVRDANDVHAILSALHDTGTALPGMDVRKPNLEEVFLALTGETLHDHAAVKADGEAP
jgi:ABC-2 type transport system ATP-binding protein